MPRDALVVLSLRKEAKREQSLTVVSGSWEVLTSTVVLARTGVLTSTVVLARTVVLGRTVVLDRRVVLEGFMWWQCS